MKEQILKPKQGMPVLLLTLLSYALAIAVFVFGCINLDNTPVLGGLLMAIGIIWFCLGWILFCGLKVLKPQEALVLTLFGKYVGTLRGGVFLLCESLCCRSKSGGEDYFTAKRRCG